MTTEPAASLADHADLRRKKRAARRALHGLERQSAEAAIIAHIRGLTGYRSASRVGTFIAFDGEPNLSTLQQHDSGKQFCVPVIGRRSMRFASLDPGRATTGNRFGIPEPLRPQFVPTGSLDVVLTPLVAFDDAGVRVGVGGGYYDRCFAGLRNRLLWFRPRLVGIAFECQHVQDITASPWDVPLWGVITEHGFRSFLRR